MGFRNIAIVAHVDHGKTTLVDALLKQCKTFSEHESVADRVMDSMDLERERGITITAKNTAVYYEGEKINILDTPGHADFSGEVERVLTMVEAVMLLVDASEGPLPGTRFVLRKAMERRLTPIVVINKIDRPDARINEVVQAVYDLFIDLGADDSQLEFPILYCMARAGMAFYKVGDASEDLRPLLDTILRVVPEPPPPAENGSAQLLITNLAYDTYVGRIAIGRLFGAPIKRGDGATWHHASGQQNVRLQLLYTWRGLKRHEVQVAEAGDIVAVAGIEDITVGDTISAGPERAAMARIVVDEPTLGMTFAPNNSPLSGRDGRLLTSRQIRERLEKELLVNVSLRMEETPSRESYKIFGRGELQLGILIEQMRREGFELTLSRPEVVRKEVDGKTLEPYELLTIDVPDPSVGALTQWLAPRKGQMVDMRADGSGRTMMVYRIPSRGLIGFRGMMLTETRGEGTLSTAFDGWDEDAGYIQGRLNGSLVNDRGGKTTAYALHTIQDRGVLFVGAGVEAYEGMIIGINARENDMNVNAVREKQLNNIRTHAADEKLTLVPPLLMSLEAAIEFIDEDERIEVTPTSIRLRKAILESNRRGVIRGERASE
jgi:GTP-binding protein